MDTIVAIDSHMSVHIGRIGENKVRTICFDVTSWIQQYGSGIIFTVIFERADGVIYPVASRMEGAYVSVVITNTETAVEGPGCFEIRLYCKDMLRKSARFRSICAAAISEPEEPPDPPGKSWIDQIMEEIASRDGPSNLKLGRAMRWDEEGRLSVDVADNKGADKTKPVSESYVDTVVGNIEVLLETI